VGDLTIQAAGMIKHILNTLICLPCIVFIVYLIHLDHRVDMNHGGPASPLQADCNTQP
jgi:hypothetical protein